MAGAGGQFSSVERSITDALIATIEATDFEQMPAALVQFAKRSIYDTIAVACAGARTPGMAKMSGAILAEAGSAFGPSTRWGADCKLSPTYAAFVNASHAAALEYDSIHLKGIVHADAVTVPAALATAELKTSSGREFLRAVILGTEVACRLGLAASSRRGWFYTSIYGIFGATVATGVLSRLNPSGFNAALGLALAQCSGAQQPQTSVTLAKPLQFGLASRAAVFAALLAEQGLEGSCRTVEGSVGLYSLYETGRPESILASFGERFHMADTAIKKYPCCSCSHAALDGLLSLIAQHHIQAKDVDYLEATITPFMKKLVGFPFSPQADLQATTQFNLRYALACALARGRFSLQETEPDVVADPVIQSLTEKMHVIVDDSADGIVGPCTITVGLKGGQVVRARMDDTPGALGRPIDLEELEAKAIDCFRYGGITNQRSARILKERIDGIEDCENMAHFLDGVF